MDAPAGNGLLRRCAIPALIAAATFIAFAPALHGEFLNWDDDVNFLNNPHYRGLGAGNLHWMFSNYSGHYMPLTWLTLGLDYVLWGMDPFGYHLTSLLLHVLNAGLVWLLLDRLLRRAMPAADDVRRRWSAAAGGLFFSIHPLRVESVAWVTERRDLVSGVFFLLTLLAYLRMSESAPGSRGRRAWLAASAAAFAASLLGKAMGMTLPLVLFLLDAWPLRRFGREKTASLVAEKIPFILLMGAAIVLTSLGQRQVQALSGLDHYPLTQMLTQPGSRVSFYVLKTLLPVGLSPLYFYRAELGLPQALGWVAVLLLTILTLRRWRQAPAPAVAWLSYGFLIAPVSGIVQAGPHDTADRYSYLACLPFAALIAGALCRPAGARGRNVLHVVAGLLLAVLGVLTLRQCGFWKDSLTLWSRALEVGPPNHLALLNRGTARLEVGDAAGAVEDYSRSLEINPAYVKSWNSRGLARERLGDLGGARSDYDEALRLRPDYPLAWTNRGSLRRRAGDLPGALADAEEAVRRDPAGGNGYILRAGLRRSQGDLKGAGEDYDRAVAVAPLSVEALNNRGMLRLQTGRPAEAFADYDRALSLKPGNPPVLVGRGQARLLTGDAAGAAADFDLALRSAPRDWPLRHDVEVLLQRAQAARGLR